MAVLAEQSSDGVASIAAAPGRRGSATRATRPSEGEAGHNVLPEGNTEDTLRSQPVSTKLRRIAERAAQNPELVFTALAHLIDVAWLREAYRLTRKDGSTGIDGVTAAAYAANLDANADAYGASATPRRP